MDRKKTEADRKHKTASDKPDPGATAPGRKPRKARPMAVDRLKR